MSFGAGEHLENCQKSIEVSARHPLLIVDQLAPNHRDLGDGTTKREQAEAQEADEQLRVGEIGRDRFFPDSSHNPSPPAATIRALRIASAR